MRDGVKSANCCFASSSGQGFFFFPAWHESQSFIRSLAKRKVVTRWSSVLLFLALIFVLKYRSRRTNYKVDVFERFGFFFPFGC